MRSMNDLLSSLENTAVSQWILSSDWGYPILLTLHSLGLGLLVGLLVVIDLRILGFVRALPLGALRKLMPWVWVGFLANAVSGALLFMADATKDFYANSFRIKIVCIVIGVAIAVYLDARVLRDGAALEVPRAATVLAWASLASWTGAIVAGRLIAYLT